MASTLCKKYPLKHMLCLYNYERFTLNTFLAISLCFVPFSLADKYFSTIFCAQISSLCKCWRFGMKLIKLKNVTMNRVAPENCSKSNFSFILLSITWKEWYLVFVLIFIPLSFLHENYRAVTWVQRKNIFWRKFAEFKKFQLPNGIKAS